MNTKIQNDVVGFGLSFLIMSITSAVLVILKEENKALMDWMKALMGHHWVTHGAFTIVLFLILGALFSRLPMGKDWTEKHLITMVLAGTIISGILLGGFFLLE
jgi:hypothetical protein